MEPRDTAQALEQLHTLAISIMLDDASAHAEKARAHQAFAPRVQAAIEHHIATKNELLLADRVASALCVSGATLRRQLRLEQTSYQKIADTVRCSLAKALLTASGLSTNDISEQLGFAAPSAFTRAFSDWTGLAPTRYRAQFGDPEKIRRTDKRGRTAAPRHSIFNLYHPVGHNDREI